MIVEQDASSCVCSLHNHLDANAGVCEELMCLKRGGTGVPLMTHLILKSSAASLALSISSISRAFSSVLLLT